MQEQLNELRDLATRHAGAALRVETPVARLVITVRRETTAPVSGVCQAAHCLVLQGAKEVMIGERRLRYDPASYFIASVDVPASAAIVEASPERPYIGLSLGLDPDALAALLPDVPAQAVPHDASFGVSPVTPQLLDAWLRLVRLLDAPQDIPVLGPLLEREILYRLLQGPQGGVLRQIALADSRLARVRRAIACIRARFDQPLRIEELAELAGMSPASFHRHFKAATAMSPLQYQKTLRLQEARRRLIADPDAARAGYAVGYESASQFSREYARLFGAPPARDAARLRGEGATDPQIADAA
jgi:AraC-like DNA-binding protein